jgi:hypothetical protein
LQRTERPAITPVAVSSSAGVGAPCVGVEILPAIAIPVEDHRVQVDLAAVGID